MNSIQAVFDKSDYEIYDDYPNYKIDSYFLDEKLAEFYPDKSLKGLVPTLLDWMINENESKIVWERIFPDKNETKNCPILMCPDDCDFSCIIIIAEIKNIDNQIIWERIGINKTGETESEKIGSNVEWFDKYFSFKFNINEYTKMIKIFEKSRQNNI